MVLLSCDILWYYDLDAAILSPDRCGIIVIATTKVRIILTQYIWLELNKIALNYMQHNTIIYRSFINIIIKRHTHAVSPNSMHHIPNTYMALFCYQVYVIIFGVLMYLSSASYWPISWLRSWGVLNEFLLCIVPCEIISHFLGYMFESNVISSDKPQFLRVHMRICEIKNITALDLEIACIFGVCRVTRPQQSLFCRPSSDPRYISGQLRKRRRVTTIDMIVM